MRIATWNINSVRARTERAVGVLGRWNLDVERIRVTLGPPPPRPRPMQDAPRRRHPRVVLPQEEVEELRRACPETLSDEAAEGLARLRAYFARRFPRA